MNESTGYEIRVSGVLDKKWTNYFSPFMLELGTEQTILCGTVHDQAELFGILLKIRDLGLKLISVNSMNRVGNRAV